MRSPAGWNPLESHGVNYGDSLECPSRGPSGLFSEPTYIHIKDSKKFALI